MIIHLGKRGKEFTSRDKTLGEDASKQEPPEDPSFQAQA